MGLTTDRDDDGLHETDAATGQRRFYLVLPDGERKDFVRPVRRSYVHLKCGAVTTMGEALAETWATDVNFYSGTFCCACRGHFPVAQFNWEDGQALGS